ncbi:hypothetical protein NIES2119_21435 [[Phormidium ambiguum] IAM M-71]|uniref:MotA/TolQ/ExbB proton channel domain-containing protein n=1 Tax=[Phormidium ambiguum] IAM M-71 TaxID=454136 RepID=A0A1U7IBM9_9CYAN|nr:hypothetical protein [Phormidium ambiguum]OKH34067.1 hypothetical protein NIES2119_21435 [Phormidium ambiguum IAM M-71]
MINEILEIVWQNSLFHWIIVLLLVLACLIEVYSTVKYIWKLKNSITNKAIDYLSYNLKTVRIIDKEPVYLDCKNLPKDSRTKIFNWLNKNLVGTELNERFQAQLQFGQFLLIQYPAILEKPVPRSSLRFIQSILIAIGVLGTFYGIQVGLSEISLSDIGENSGHLLKSSVQLLEGMKTAFSTSLMGLGSSSIFTLVLACLEWVRKKYRDSLKHKLDAITILETPMRLLEKMNPEANLKASQSLANAAEIMGTQFAELIEIQREFSPKAIGQEIGNIIKPILQEIRVELLALQEIKADRSQEILKNLIEEQREHLIKPIIIELSNSANLTKEASEAIMDLKNELGSISFSLSESIATIEHFQAETLIKLQEFATNLGANVEKTSATFITIREELEKFLNTHAEIQQQLVEEFQNNIHDIFTQQNNNLQHLGEQSSEAMRVQRDALTKIAKQTVNTFVGIREELEQSLQTHTQIERELIQEFHNRYLEIFNNHKNHNGVH